MQQDAAIEQLSAYLDGELTDAEVAELEHRLAVDASLRAELDALREAVDLLRIHGPVQAPPALYGDILRAVEDEPMPGGGFWAFLQRPFGLPLPTLALAAAGVAVVCVTVGGAVVATQPGLLRPTVADLDSSWSPAESLEQKRDDKVAAKEPSKDSPRALDKKPAPAVKSQGKAAGAAAGVEGEDAKKSAAATASTRAVGTADDPASREPSPKTELVKGVDSSAYGGSGTMYSGGPVVSVGLNPSDLERVAALYQKFAGTRDTRTAKAAERIANLPDGTTAITLDLPDEQARNAFEQELRRAFPGSFVSKPASEDGFTLNHARMRLNITVAAQVPGSSGGDVEQPPLQMMRKGQPTYEDELAAPEEQAPEVEAK